MKDKDGIEDLLGQLTKAPSERVYLDVFESLSRISPSINSRYHSRIFKAIIACCSRSSKTDEACKSALSLGLKLIQTDVSTSATALGNAAFSFVDECRKTIVNYIKKESVSISVLEICLKVLCAVNTASLVKLFSNKIGVVDFVDMVMLCLKHQDLQLMTLLLLEHGLSIPSTEALGKAIFDKTADFIEEIYPLLFANEQDTRKAALSVMQKVDLKNKPISLKKLKQATAEVYCAKLNTMVINMERDWPSIWSFIVNFFGEELHSGSQLINKMLGVIESGYKHQDIDWTRIQAFYCWKTLINNFETGFSHKKRMDLILIPLRAANHRTEALTAAKLSTYAHLLSVIANDPSKAKESDVVTHFTVFAFGADGQVDSYLPVKSYPALHDELCKTYELVLTCSKDPEFFSRAHESVFRGARECLILKVSDAKFVSKIWSALLGVIKGCEETAQYRNFVTKLFANLGKLMLISNENFAVGSIIVSPLLYSMVIGEVSLKRTVFTTATIYSGSSDVMEGTPALQIIEWLFAHSVLLGVKDREKYFHLVSEILVIGRENPAGFLTFVLSTLKKMQSTAERAVNVLNDQNSTLVIGFLTKVWIRLADQVLVFLKSGGEINQGDAAQHDFGCIYLALLYPAQHLPQYSERLAECSPLWRDIYEESSKQAALIATAGDHEFCEQLCSKLAAMTRPNGSLKQIGAVYHFLALILKVESGDGSKSGKRWSNTQRLVSDILSNIVNYGVGSNEAFMEAAGCLYCCFLSPTSSNQVLEKLCKILCALLKEKYFTYEPVNKVFEVFSVLRKTVLYVKQHSKEIPKSVRAALESVLEAGQVHASQKLRGATHELRGAIEGKNCSNDSQDLPSSSTALSFVGSVLQQGSTPLHSPGVTFSFAKDDSPPKKSPKGQNQKIPQSGLSSSEFVKIDTPPKKMILTEHQKEVMRQRRQDIPALYQDLTQDTQSLSQDSTHEVIVLPSTPSRKAKAPPLDVEEHAVMDIEDVNASVQVLSPDKYESSPPRTAAAERKKDPTSQFTPPSGFLAPLNSNLKKRDIFVSSTDNSENSMKNDVSQNSNCVADSSSESAAVPKFDSFTHRRKSSMPVKKDIAITRSVMHQKTRSGKVRHSLFDSNVETKRKSARKSLPSVFMKEKTTNLKSDVSFTDSEGGTDTESVSSDNSFKVNKGKGRVKKKESTISNGSAFVGITECDVSDSGSLESKSSFHKNFWQVRTGKKIGNDLLKESTSEMFVNCEGGTDTESVSSESSLSRKKTEGKKKKKSENEVKVPSFEMLVDGDGGTDNESVSSESSLSKKGQGKKKEDAASLEVITGTNNQCDVSAVAESVATNYSAIPKSTRSKRKKDESAVLNELTAFPAPGSSSHVNEGTSIPNSLDNDTVNICSVEQVTQEISTQKQTEKTLGGKGLRRSCSNSSLDEILRKSKKDFASTEVTDSQDIIESSQEPISNITKPCAVSLRPFKDIEPNGKVELPDVVLVKGPEASSPYKVVKSLTYDTVPVRSACKVLSMDTPKDYPSPSTDMVLKVSETGTPVSNGTNQNESHHEKQKSPSKVNNKSVPSSQNTSSSHQRCLFVSSEDSVGKAAQSPPSSSASRQVNGDSPPMTCDSAVAMRNGSLPEWMHEKKTSPASKPLRGGSLRRSAGARSQAFLKPISESEVVISPPRCADDAGSASPVLPKKVLKSDSNVNVSPIMKRSGRAAQLLGLGQAAAVRGGEKVVASSPVSVRADRPEDTESVSTNVSTNNSVENGSSSPVVASSMVGGSSDCSLASPSVRRRGKLLLRPDTESPKCTPSKTLKDEGVHENWVPKTPSISEATPNSILKRKRDVDSEAHSPSTKKKRVSFRDPPLASLLSFNEVESCGTVISSARMDGGNEVGKDSFFEGEKFTNQNDKTGRERKTVDFSGTRLEEVNLFDSDPKRNGKRSREMDEEGLHKGKRKLRSKAEEGGKHCEVTETRLSFVPKVLLHEEENKLLNQSPKQNVSENSSSDHIPMLPSPVVKNVAEYNDDNERNLNSKESCENMLVQEENSGGSLKIAAESLRRSGRIVDQLNCSDTGKEEEGIVRRVVRSTSKDSSPTKENNEMQKKGLDSPNKVTSKNILSPKKDLSPKRELLNIELSPKRDRISNKELSPIKDLSSKTDFSVNKSCIFVHKVLSPKKDKSPEKEFPPKRDRSTEKELSPKNDRSSDNDSQEKDLSPRSSEKVLSPKRNKTLEKDLTPIKDKTSQNYLSPKRDLTPVKRKDSQKTGILSPRKELSPKICRGTQPTITEMISKLKGMEGRFVRSSSEEEHEFNTQGMLEDLRENALTSNPVFPSLVNCDHPIDTIVSDLTTAAWRKGLLGELIRKDIKTVGGLAALSQERINRFNFKKPGVETVRLALKNFNDRHDESPYYIGTCGLTKASGSPSSRNAKILRIAMADSRAEDIVKNLTELIDETELCKSISSDTLLKVLLQRSGVDGVLNELVDRDEKAITQTVVSRANVDTVLDILKPEDVGSAVSVRKSILNTIPPDTIAEFYFSQIENSSGKREYNLSVRTLSAFLKKVDPKTLEELVCPSNKNKQPLIGLNVLSDFVLKEENAKTLSSHNLDIIRDLALKLTDVNDLSKHILQAIDSGNVSSDNLELLMQGIISKMDAKNLFKLLCNKGLELC